MPIAPLDDFGVFVAGFGGLKGQSAVEHTTADWVLNDLQQKGRLLAVEKYPHSYPHCWRCKTELLFRLVDEWFINMKWRDEIKEVVQQITWLPESINGKARELDWLNNMGDWMISKKRFWGLALPVWVDPETDDFEVIGSREELKERAVEGWEQFEGHSPHRPWIDLVKIRNPKTGNLMSRIPDVGNPWLDAGIVPYSTMKYNTDRQYWAEWFPADFITESFPGQFRNWFYALLAMSTMMENRLPTRVILGHGLVRDQNGKPMHKSDGNAIPFEGAADTGYELFCKRDPKLKPEQQAAKELPSGYSSLKEETIRLGKDQVLVLKGVGYPPMSADLIRWLYCRTNPAANVNFGPGPADDLRSKFTLKLWNTYAFFCNYAQLDAFDRDAPQVPVHKRPDIDRWILSDLQLLVQLARTSFESYDVAKFCVAAEAFVDDKLSNWYVRRNRRRFWKSEQGVDKLAAYQTLFTVLLTLSKLFAPIMPYLAEAIYRNLIGANPDSDASVHLCPFPEPEEALIDPELSADMDALLNLVSLGSAARNTVKIKVRQPLAELQVKPGDQSVRRAVERFADQITDELNLKRVTLHTNDGPLLHFQVKPNMKTLGPKFGQRLREVVAALAAADPAWVAQQVNGGQSIALPCPGGEVTLEPADVLVQVIAKEGWTGLEDRKTQLALDTRITEELKLEGYGTRGGARFRTERPQGCQFGDERPHCAAPCDGECGDGKGYRGSPRLHRCRVPGGALVGGVARHPGVSGGGQNRGAIR